MKFMIFEGTTEEFSEVAPAMGLDQPIPRVHQNSSEPQHQNAPSASEGFVTLEQAKSVLGRRPLHEKVIIMLRMLYKAGDKRVSSDQIKKAIQFTAPQFRGMMGAFGRRLVNTQGIPKGVKFLDQEWSHELHQVMWSLPKNSRKALEDLKIV